MILFAWMLLLAAPPRMELVDEVDQVPAGDWKYVEVQLHQQPARISASYEVQRGSNVRAALMLRDDVDRMREDLPGNIAATQEGPAGYLSDGMRRRGDYVVVLDNQNGHRAASVHLRVWLDFAPGPDTEVTQLSPRRRWTVVVLSLAVFLGMVTYSARRLLQAMRG